jgi:hypothetical protein
MDNIQTITSDNWITNLNSGLVNDNGRKLSIEEITERSINFMKKLDVQLINEKLEQSEYKELTEEIRSKTESIIQSRMRKFEQKSWQRRILYIAFCVSGIGILLFISLRRKYGLMKSSIHQQSEKMNMALKYKIPLTVSNDLLGIQASFKDKFEQVTKELLVDYNKPYIDTGVAFDPKTKGNIHQQNFMIDEEMLETEIIDLFHADMTRAGTDKVRIKENETFHNYQGIEACTQAIYLQTRNEKDRKWEPILQHATTQTNGNTIFFPINFHFNELRNHLKDDNYYFDGKPTNSIAPILSIHRDSEGNISKVKVKYENFYQLLLCKEGGKVEAALPEAIKGTLHYTITMNEQGEPIYISKLVNLEPSAI